MDVSEAVRAAIENHGPISFAEFMELALYGPGGFYEEPPVGEDGHFTTSPHVHPVFARLLADAVAGLWTAMGRPDPFSLIELGAGDGTLGERVLKNLPTPAARYTAVEQSAIARDAIHARGMNAVAELPAEDPMPTVLFANELLDNLPFHRIRAGADGTISEIRVGLAGGLAGGGPADGFVEVEAPCPPDLHRSLRPGQEATVPIRAFELVDRLAGLIQHGYILLIDYGSQAGTAGDTDTGHEPAGDVHGYRNQRLIEDVLDAPGTADITAGVDFARLSARAADAGFHVFPAVSQRDALIHLGFDRWNRAERERQTDLLDQGSGSEAVRAWGSRNEANLLVDPKALGRLRWLVLATTGLPAPSWVPDEEIDRP